MSRVGEGLRDASRKTYREIYIRMYVRNYLESIKFVYYNINLYTRTHVHFRQGKSFLHYCWKVVYNLYIFEQRKKNTKTFKNLNT